MTPASRWRRVAVGTVLAADVLLVVLGAPALPAFVPFAGVALLLATGWALWRPNGSGGLALVLLQAVAFGVFRAAPESVTDWALTALAAALVLVTHLSLALLGAWAPGAALPRPALVRWGRQAGVLAALGGVVAGVGYAGAATPSAAWQWVAAAALLLAVATIVLTHRAVRSR